MKVAKVESSVKHRAIRFVRHLFWTAFVLGACFSVVTRVLWVHTAGTADAWTWGGFLGTWWGLSFSLVIAIWVRETYLTSGRLEAATTEIAQLATAASENARAAEAAATTANASLQAVRDAVDHVEDVALSTLTVAEAGREAIVQIVEDGSAWRNPPTERLSHATRIIPWEQASLRDAPQPVKDGIREHFHGLTVSLYEDRDRGRWLALVDRNSWPSSLIILENGKCVSTRFTDADYVSTADLLFLL